MSTVMVPSRSDNTAASRSSAAVPCCTQLGHRGVVGDQHAVEAEFAAQDVLEQVLVGRHRHAAGSGRECGHHRRRARRDARGERRQMELPDRAFGQIDIGVVLAALRRRRNPR